MSFTRGVFEALGGEQFSGYVEPFMLTLESGSSSGPHNIVHTGHEFVFCLRGQLEYYVESKFFSYPLEIVCCSLQSCSTVGRILPEML